MPLLLKINAKNIMNYRRCLSPTESFLWACKQENFENLVIFYEQIKSNFSDDTLNNKQKIKIINEGFINCCEFDNLDFCKYLYSQKMGITKLFKRYIDINYNNNEGFIIACKNNNIRIVTWMSKLNDFKFRFYSRQLFEDCCLSDSLYTATFLYDKENYVINVNLLISCIKKNCVNVIKWLCTFPHIFDYLNENCLTIFETACEKNQTELASHVYLKFKISYIDNTQLFCTMIKNNNVETVAWYSKRIPNVDITVINKENLLEYCCDRQYTDMISLLCEFTEVDTTVNNFMVFRYACINDMIHLAESLYESHKNQMNFSLHEKKQLGFMCCLYGRYEIVKFLHSIYDIFDENIIDDIYFKICCEMLMSESLFLDELKDCLTNEKLILPDDNYHDVDNNYYEHNVESLKKLFSYSNNTINMSEYLKLVKWFASINSRYSVTESDEGFKYFINE